jgi:hypothetical protein
MKTSLFYGREVEHTKFHGEPTLFVEGEVGYASIKAALRRLWDEHKPVNHVYLGARYSLPGVPYLCSAAKALLMSGCKVTLDVPVEHLPFIYDEGLHKLPTPEGPGAPGLMCVNVRVPMPGVDNDSDWERTIWIKTDQPVTRDAIGTVSETQPKSKAIYVCSLRDLLQRSDGTLWDEYVGDVDLPIT